MTEDIRNSGNICENFISSWKIEKFSSLDATVGKVYYSDYFPSIGDTSVLWNLWLYPGGRNHENEGNVQCEIYCENELEVKIPAKVTLSIRNSDNETIASSQDEEWRKLRSGLIRDFLGTPRSGLLDKLNDGTVVIAVEVIYSTSDAETGETTSTLGKISSHAAISGVHCNLPERMKTDAVIVVDGTEIPVHSAILGARSKVFAAMFEHETFDSNERRIQIVDFEVELVKSMVHFMYSGTVDGLDFPLAMGLLRIGDKYELDVLISHCTNFLSAKLDESNVVEVLFLADTLSSCAEIRDKGIEYICENASLADLESKFSTLKDKPDIVFDVIVRMKQSRSI